MLLYDRDVAPNPRRVRIFLAEKGISVPTQQVDLAGLEHRREPFTRVNPRQLVPALALDDGTCISETVAICRYFEETQPEPPLFGTGAVERAQVEMWQRRMELELLYPTMHAFRHLHPAMAEREKPQVPEWGEANKPKVIAFLRWLDADLADGRPFLVGKTFTIADITGLCGIDFMQRARIAVPEDLTNLRAWYDRVSTRPSAKA